MPLLTTIPAVAPSTTYIFGFILILMVLALALEEKFHIQKSLITGLGATLSLFLGGFLLPIPHSTGHLPFYIPYVDWEVVLIILGSSLFVDIVSKSGIFSWTALKLTKWSQGDPFLLLIFYSLLTVIFSALLNNVTAMIIIGSLTMISLTRLGLREKLLGFLLVEGLLTNVGGLLTLISSVPNIILGQKAGISFVGFFLKASPYVFICTALTIYMGKVLFGIHSLTSDEEKENAKKLLESFDEKEGIESKNFFYFSWAMFGLLIFLFSAQSVLPIFKDLGLGFIAMAMAILVLVKYKNEVNKNYKALDWDLIFFFIFLFIVIGVMEHAGVLKMLGTVISGLIGLGDKMGALALLCSSAGISSVTDNIPLAAVLANILGDMKLASDSNLWWAVIFGANLGGNITPIGSASTVVAVTIIHKNNLKLTFLEFIWKALPFALLQIILAGIYIILFL